MENHPAYKYSIRILSKRDYSRAKIKKKLLERDYAEVANKVIELLIKKKYLREEYYIEARIKGLMKKNYSPSYIISKLREEDVSANLEQIQEIFSEWDISTFDQIEDLIRKKLILHNWSEEERKLPSNRAKIMRFLQSKGHCWQEMQEVL